MGTEEAIIYSYDLATVPSVIPAFANAKDVLICDEVRQSCHGEHHILFGSTHQREAETAPKRAKA